MRLLLLSLLLCCFATPRSAGQQMSRRAVARALDHRIAQNETFATGHTGFALYDLDAERSLYGYQADRYFVPASNTKLLTFLLANRVLAAGAPAVFYRDSAGYTDLWGSGYPLLLHPAFADYDVLHPWLARRAKPLVLHYPADEAVPRYGAGWSWDDYDYGYVFERTALPVYGNRLYLDYRETSPGKQVLYGSPAGVVEDLTEVSDQQRLISRAEGSNRFTVRPQFSRPQNFPLERSLTMDSTSTLRFLREGLPGSTVTSGTLARPPRDRLDTVRAFIPDTVYQTLLQDSDNYLAEQLLLLTAATRYGRPDGERILDWATDTLFRELDLGEISYRDGSGLTRYNLISPEQLAEVVAALDREVGRERLRRLLPAGGVNGTLKTRFDNRRTTYVWAKTGSLTGVIAVSGLLRTARGRWLGFSFVHNNVVASSRDYYREMEAILGWIHDQL